MSTNHEKIMSVLNKAYQTISECSKISGVSKDITRVVLKDLARCNEISTVTEKSPRTNHRAQMFKLKDPSEKKLISMKWCA